MNGCSALHMSIFGMNPIVKYGSEDLKRRSLPRVAAGDLHVAFGVTEPDSGSDTTSITTRARLDGDHYLVRGQKVWTTKAQDCEKVLLLVRTTPIEECRKRTDGLTLLFADLQRPEVDITPIPKLGRNAVASCEVRYDDLPVAVEDRVGEEGMGFRYLLDGLNPERILIASEALGIGKVSVRTAVEYANQRRVFGRPIGQNQGDRLPAGRGAHAAARRRAGRPRGVLALRPRAALRGAGQHREVARGRRRPLRAPTAPCRPTAASATRSSTTCPATSSRRG